MAFELAALPYAYDALEPYIDATTMTIHHTKHHQAYLTKLNDAIKGSALETKSAEAIIADLNAVPENIRGVVRNNGGGFVNHNFFWQVMGPGKGGTPAGKVGDAIKSTFGSFEEFKKVFANAAITRFGSGWAWLVAKDGKLAVTSTPNQDSPLMDNSGTPILGLDVWEHAYYLKYQNRRPDYIESWWNVVNWDVVAKNLAAVR